MKSSTYIFVLVVFSASFICSLGAKISTSPVTPKAEPTESTLTSEKSGTSTKPEMTPAQGTGRAEDAENTDASSTSEATTSEATATTGNPEDAENIDTSSTAETSVSEATETTGNPEDAENIDTSSTAEPSTSEAADATDSADAATAGNGSCIEVTLPDALGIGKCLGANLDLCQNQNTLVPGVMSLVNCTLTSVFRNVSPQNFLVTVKDILVALISKLEPGVVPLAESFLERMKPSENATIANGTCEGEIKIGIPNSLGKCLDKTLKLCEKGKPVDISVLESLVKAVGCIVKDLFTTAPQETLKNLLCDLVKLIGDLFGNTVKTAVVALCSS